MKWVSDVLGHNDVGRNDYSILTGKWGPWTSLRSLFST